MDRVPLIKALIASRFAGNAAMLARAIGKPPSLVSQWVGGHRKLGDGSARNIELRLGLVMGYFDRADIATSRAEQPVQNYVVEAPDPQLRDLVADWAYLLESQRTEILQTVAKYAAIGREHEARTLAKTGRKVVSHPGIGVRDPPPNPGPGQSRLQRPSSR